MIHIGFTGTRKGITFLQRHRLNGMLWRAGSPEFHHGCCDGADAEAHAIAYDAGCRIHGHPPTNPAYRADLTFRETDIVYPAKPYLVRNHDIVDATQTLIAAPAEHTEQLRSGTWSTIRYARKRRKHTIIVYPDGSIQTINEPANDPDMFPSLIVSLILWTPLFLVMVAAWVFGHN